MFLPLGGDSIIMATLPAAAATAAEDACAAPTHEERELLRGVPMLGGLTCKECPCDTAREPRVRPPKVVLEDAGIRAEPPAGASC